MCLSIYAWSAFAVHGTSYVRVDNVQMQFTHAHTRTEPHRCGLPDNGVTVPHSYVAMLCLGSAQPSRKPINAIVTRANVCKPNGMNYASRDVPDKAVPNGNSDSIGELKITTTQAVDGFFAVKCESNNSIMKIF